MCVISHLKRIISDFVLPGTTTVVSAVRFLFVTELKATQVRAVSYGGVTGVNNMEAFLESSLPR